MYACDLCDYKSARKAKNSNSQSEVVIGKILNVTNVNIRVLLLST